MIIPILTSNNSQGYVITKSVASSWSGGGDSWKAFDGANSTGWFSPSVPAWIAIDCGSLQAVGSVKIRSRHNASTGYNGFPTDFEILGSNDGATWVSIKSYTGVSWSNNEEKEFVFDSIVNYQHFKISVTNGSTGNVIINSIQLYNEGVVENPTTPITPSNPTAPSNGFTVNVDRHENGEVVINLLDGDTWKKYVPRAGFREVYIMAGQSNMVGHGALSQLPVFSNANRCFIYKYNEQWGAGQEPMSDHSDIVYGIFYDDDDKASMGMPFADCMAELSPCNEIGLVPCAKGGSGLTAWQRNLDPSSLYGAMIARANAALQEDNTILKGIVWYQGEEDAKTYSNANEWRQRFEQFISDIRSDLGYSIPVVCVRLAVTTQTNERPYWSIVQSQQDSVNIEKCALVNTSDLRVFDGVHLDTASLVTLGNRVALAMNSLDEREEHQNV